MKGVPDTNSLTKERILSVIQTIDRILICLPRKASLRLILENKSLILFEQ